MRIDGGHGADTPLPTLGDLASTYPHGPREAEVRPHGLRRG
jgi:hypothetical protein